MPDRLREWALRPGAARLLGQVRARREAGGFGPGSRAAIAVPGADRADVGRLLGTHWEAGAEAVTARALHARLAAYGVDLDRLLTEVGGPLRDLPAERAAAQRRAAEESAAARAVLRSLLGPEGEVPDIVVHGAALACLPPAGTGAALARARDLERVWAHLPARGAGGAAPPETLPLAVLAARALGDAHAVDRDVALGRSAARLAAHVVAARTGDQVIDPLAAASAWRAAWAGVGVACDEVSSTVLVLGLPLAAPAAAAALTRAAPAEPVWLTLRALGDEPRPEPGLRTVFVCENPAIVEAAAGLLGASSAPLVCTFGRPGLAAFRLLAGLAAAGVEVRVGADGDEVGRQIVADVCAAVPGASPWRMDSDTYEEERLEGLLADLAAAARVTEQESP